MNSEDLPEYNNKCDVIKELIIKNYTNNTFDFIRNPDTLYIEVIINNKSNVTILPDNTWTEIKRHITKKIIVQCDGIVEDCIICCGTIKKNVTCPKCSINYCSECYINIFKHGKGVITCPHCRYSFGNVMPEYMLKSGVDQIRQKLGQMER